MPNKTIVAAAVAAVALTLAVTALAEAHDMFLKPVRYYIEPNAATIVREQTGWRRRFERSATSGRFCPPVHASSFGTSR